MPENKLLTESKEFAKEILLLCRELKNRNVEAPIREQLLRSGTSVGANIYEAQYAQGTKDFISKFEIALKECNESEYWLELIRATNGMTSDEFKTFQNYCVDLRRMLVSSVNTLKSKKQNPAHDQIKRM